MSRVTIVLLVAIVVFSALIILGCADDGPDIIIITGPRLPKIDCEAYVNLAAGNVGARGLGNSPVGVSLINQARRDCAEMNAARGY